MAGKDGSTDVKPDRWHDSWVRYCELGRVGLVLHRVDYPDGTPDRERERNPYAVCLVSVACPPTGYHRMMAQVMTLGAGRLDLAEEVYAQCEANLRAGEYEAWAAQF